MSRIKLRKALYDEKARRRKTGCTATTAAAGAATIESGAKEKAKPAGKKTPAKAASVRKASGTR